MTSTDRNDNNEKRIPVQPYTTKQLAGFYHVCSETLNNWLIPFREQIGQRTGNLYTPKQVRIIFNCLDWPEA